MIGQADALGRVEVLGDAVLMASFTDDVARLAEVQGGMVAGHRSRGGLDGGRVVDRVREVDVDRGRRRARRSTVLPTHP